MIWTPWYISSVCWVVRNWCKVSLWLFWSHAITLDVLYVMFDFMSACWGRYVNWSLMDLSWWSNCWHLILLLQKLKHSVIPAVEVEHPGCSFNPSEESHKVTLVFYTYLDCLGVLSHITWHFNLFFLCQVRMFWLMLLRKKCRKSIRMSWDLSQSH